MVSLSTGNSNLKFDLIEKVPFRESDIVNENDSGVFSDTTVSSQLPIYITRQRNNSDESCRKINKKRASSVRRAVSKSGKPNVVRIKIPYLWTAYIRDIGNTLVNSRWRWTILCFASSYVFSWLFFSWFYMLIAQDNNDISETNPSTKPCLVGINTFAGYFLFSVETQHTIGYGSRYITENCTEGIFLISLQMILSVALCGGMASIVYTKMVIPHSHPSSRLFSKTCVICQRDGGLSLMFRVRDKHNSHQVNTKINVYLVQNKNGEPFLKSVSLEPLGFLLWPLEVEHKITSSSPFWNFSAKDLISKSFEILVTMDGISRTTGQCSMSRTSYLSKEILWGHRFKPCVRFDNVKQAYYVDINDFNTTEEVMTPLCSAQRLHEVLEEVTLVKPVVMQYEGDMGSFRSSSGIGSIRDEIITAEVYSDNNSSNVILRKLSTITEFSSFENLKPSGSNEPKTSITLEEIHSSSDCTPSNEDDNMKSNEKAKNQSVGIFSIQGLISSLQNYLKENQVSVNTNHNDSRETNC